MKNNMTRQNSFINLPSRIVHMNRTVIIIHAFQTDEEMWIEKTDIVIHFGKSDPFASLFQQEDFATKDWFLPQTVTTSMSLQLNLNSRAYFYTNKGER